MKRARLSVRMLTHTLHLPPALSEIYGGPRPEWLRDILDYLPCLQSLIVSKLPFFDHNAMVALRKQPASLQTYNLRLLLAEREPNTTSAGIAEALSRFPALVYLDLSYTTSARDQTVLSTLSLLQDLQVLKLRGIGLKDADAEFIANAIGTRVRFLDLRNNKLTDMAVRSLMQASFLPPENSFDNGRDAASRMRRPSYRLGDLLKSPELDDMFMQQLARPLTGNSFFENLPHDGITHLYLADNQITVEGVAGLLASGRLHVLDVGTVDTAQSITRGQNAVPRGHGDSSAGFPGAEKLIPILGASAKEHLTYLRVHHAVVTKETPVQNKISPAVLLPELPGEIAHSELSATQQVLELDAGNEFFELPSNSGPIFELADTSVSPATSINGTNGMRHTRHEDEPLPEIRRGSVFAPEVVEPDTEDGNIILDARGTGLSLSRQSPAQEQPSPFSTLSADHRSGISDPTVEPSSPTPAPDLRSQKIQELLAKRPKSSTLPLRNSKDAAFPYLYPSHVPHLETLVLTDVPSHVPANSPILSSLIRFITACSNEELLATLQARSNYSLPPGRARINAEKQHARDLFSLRRLVLEITPVSKGRSGQKNLSPWKPEGYRNVTFKSSTGDQDSENLWSAAMNDFSFFGNEECGIPENDPGKYFPMPVLDEKVVLVPEDERSNHSRPSSVSSPLSPNSPYNNHNNNNTLHQPSPDLRPQQRRSRPNSMTLQPTSSPVGSYPSISLHPGNNNINSETQPRPTFEEPEIDLVSELAAFRRSKKAEYEALVNSARRQHNNNRSTSTSSLLSPLSSTSRSRSPSPSPSPSQSQFPAPSSTTGTMEHHHHRHHQPTVIPLSVEGHWKGEVKIVRNAAPKGRSGVVDLFGNYFEKGYLYP